MHTNSEPIQFNMITELCARANSLILTCILMYLCTISIKVSMVARVGGVITRGCHIDIMYNVCRYVPRIRQGEHAGGVVERTHFTEWQLDKRRRFHKSTRLSLSTRERVHSSAR